MGTEKTKLLIDAGVTGKMIEEALASIGENIRALNAILVTHEHIDHIKSVGALSRKYDIPVFANAPTWEAMHAKVGEVSLKNTCVIADSDFYVRDMCVEAYDIPHDAAKPCGYRVSAGSQSVAVLTDLGHYEKSMTDMLSGTDMVLLEANHDIHMVETSRYPASLKRRILGRRGHLSNEAAAQAALELVKHGVQGIVLGHLSKENNYEHLAYQAVADKLASAGVDLSADVMLALAYREKISGMYYIGDRMEHCG